jgi:hypothetical protein
MRHKRDSTSPVQRLLRFRTKRVFLLIMNSASRFAPAIPVLATQDGQLAWRQHAGGHTDAPNWNFSIPRADKFLRHGGEEKAR